MIKKLKNYPKIQQKYDYDCGAAALLSVLLHYNIYPERDHIYSVLPLNPATGTTYDNLEGAARHYGLTPRTQKLTIDDLKINIDNGHPTLICLQAWESEKRDTHLNNYDDGHYVVVIGYDSENVHLADPWTPQPTHLSFIDLMDRWHDYEDRPDGTTVVNENHGMTFVRQDGKAPKPIPSIDLNDFEIISLYNPKN